MARRWREDCVSSGPDAPDAVRTAPESEPKPRAARAPPDAIAATRMNRTPCSDHVHELHLTYISSGTISSPLQGSFVFALQSLLDAQVVLDEIIKVVLVK